MMETSRLIVSCVALLATACGAGDNQLDPSDLELRDLLGISPEAASAWNSGQRASARRVIDDGLRQPEAPPIRAPLEQAEPTDQRVSSALASVDADRARHDAGALGLVHVAIGGGELLVTPRAATIDLHVQRPVELRLAGWDAEPAWGQLPARGPDVLSALATAAGHTSGPVVVTPAPRLAMAAGYVPATATDAARLVINPVVLAALEPVAAGSDSSAGRGRDVQRSRPSNASPAEIAAAEAPSPPSPPSPITTSGGANPYSFYGSVAECASAQRTRCQACLHDGSCTAITNAGDGDAECTTLGANHGRGYFLICINLALAIDAVSSCTEAGAPACSRDPHASESISSLEANAEFLDDAACGGPLDGCLATIYGAPHGEFPGPGSDAGSVAPPPRHTSIDCGDAWSSQDTNCELDPSCELDGPSCDDSQSYDGACSDSNDQSGCDDSGGTDTGDGCSSDSGESCGSDSTSSCDSGDGGGDCGGGGDDCSGGGGEDCSGGGGDCSGGGGDCNAAARRHRGAAGSVTPSVVWAFLPLPLAALVRRRARRRRAAAEYAEGNDDAQNGELP
jgi:hypothetical protein